MGICAEMDGKMPHFRGAGFSGTVARRLATGHRSAYLLCRQVLASRNQWNPKITFLITGIHIYAAPPRMS